MLMGQLERKLTKQINDVRVEMRQVKDMKQFQLEEMMRKEFYNQL